MPSIDAPMTARKLTVSPVFTIPPGFSSEEAVVVVVGSSETIFLCASATSTSVVLSDGSCGSVEAGADVGS